MVTGLGASLNNNKWSSCDRSVILQIWGSGHRHRASNAGGTVKTSTQMILKFLKFLQIFWTSFGFYFRFLPGLVWTGSPIFSGNLSLSNQVLWNFLKGLIFLFLSTVQHCFFWRPSDRAQDCCNFGIDSQTLYTDKKENLIFLIYKGNSEWSSGKVIYD
jgi:hypothetical protein